MTETVNHPAGKHKLTNKQRARVAWLYRKGVKIDRIAGLFRITKQNVSKIALRRGYRRRRYGEAYSVP